METMTTHASEAVLAKIKELESQLTGNLISDLELMDEIMDLKVKNGLAEKPENSPFQCVGCGS